MVICDKIPINWYFIVQEKSFNLQKLNCVNMKKIFILLFVPLALFSCEKEENNKIFEYQVLPSDNVSKPFSCMGRNVLLLLQLFKNIDRWCFRFRGSDYSQGCFDRI